MSKFMDKYHRSVQAEMDRDNKKAQEMMKTPPDTGNVEERMKFLTAVADRNRRQREYDDATRPSRGTLSPKAPKAVAGKKQKPYMPADPDMTYKNGGYVKAADGCAKKGKTKGKMV